MRAVAALLLLLLGTAPAHALFLRGGGESAFTPAPAFYVSTTGSDTNAGTLAAPFATLAKCQTAMQGSGGSKLTCYIRAGTYSTQPSGGVHCLFGQKTTIVELVSADSGETWSYYPPDGIGSAIIDGGSTVGGSGAGGGGNGLGCAFVLFQSNNVTITGLQFQRFLTSDIWVSTVSNFTASNNIFTGTTGAMFNGGDVALNGATGSTISHNYFHDDAYIGIGAWTPNSNITITGNLIWNVCTWPAVVGGGNDENGGDCGAIYEQDLNHNSTNISITNNYIRDVNAPSNIAGIYDFGVPGGEGIYLDDGVSNNTVTGNIVTGNMGYCFFNHDGQNNTITGNICDESSWIPTIVGYQTDTLALPMTGNTFENNIVVRGDSGTGSGYTGSGSPPNPMTITNNAYHNYVGASVASTGTGGAGSDSNPVSVANPQITCWSVTIAGGSAVFSAPVSFPGIPSSWGPPGITVPQTGTAPSWPHTGC